MKRICVFPVLLVCSAVILTFFSRFALAEDDFLDLKEWERGSGVKDEIKFLRTGDQSQVLFDHAAHSEVNSCKDCHAEENPIFKKTPSKQPFLMKDMNDGKYCGVCHDGKKAFSANEDCGKCHNSD